MLPAWPTSPAVCAPSPASWRPRVVPAWKLDSRERTWLASRAGRGADGLLIYGAAGTAVGVRRASFDVPPATVCGR